MGRFSPPSLGGGSPFAGLRRPADTQTALDDSKKVYLTEEN